jgi:hypothetical protein
VQVLKSTNFSGWIAVCLQPLSASYISFHMIPDIWNKLFFLSYTFLPLFYLCRLTTTSSSKSFLLLPMPLQECICTLSKAGKGSGMQKNVPVLVLAAVTKYLRIRILFSVSDSVIQQGVVSAFLKKPFKSFMVTKATGMHLFWGNSPCHLVKIIKRI